MNYALDVNLLCQCDGSGYWSRQPGVIVRVVKLEMSFVTTDDYHSANFAELMAHFDADTWENSEKGLIYTDRQWLQDFREELVALGLPKKSAYNIHYSESGMQGKSYVSLDVGKDFISGYIQLWKKLSH